MEAIRVRTWIVCFVLCGLALASTPMKTMAQDGGGRGRGNFDMTAIQQMAMGWIKEQLAAPDDEWAVLQPKLQKVMEAAIESRLNGTQLGMLLSRNAPGDRPQSPVAKAQADLKSALDDTSIGADEIASRLKVLREARQRAKEEYEAAQKELKDVLTQRQEAMLVMYGLLD